MPASTAGGRSPGGSQLNMAASRQGEGGKKKKMIAIQILPDRTGKDGVPAAALAQDIIRQANDPNRLTPQHLNAPSWLCQRGREHC